MNAVNFILERAPHGKASRMLEQRDSEESVLLKRVRRAADKWRQIFSISLPI
jgi:hypothetical protein